MALADNANARVNVLVGSRIVSYGTMASQLFQEVVVGLMLDAA